MKKIFLMLAFIYSVIFIYVNVNIHFIGFRIGSDDHVDSILVLRDVGHVEFENQSREFRNLELSVFPKNTAIEYGSDAFKKTSKYIHMFVALPIPFKFIPNLALKISGETENNSHIFRMTSPGWLGEIDGVPFIMINGTTVYKNLSQLTAEPEEKYKTWTIPAATYKKHK